MVKAIKTRKFLIIAVLALLAVAAVLFLNASHQIFAGAGENVLGFAWSETIGWISFNNLSGGGAVVYGVNINSDGTFSGYAWSENIGWIWFAPSAGYPVSPNYSVRMDLGTKQITGWARACAGTVSGDCAGAARTDGWDGWIKFGYGTGGSYIDANGDFHGWAWGSDIVGWISLNHIDTGAGAGTLYKVRTTVPTDPFGLAVSVFSSSQLDLSWTDNSTNEDGFAIERCAGLGCATFVQIGTAGALAGSGGTQTYNDTGLSAGTFYNYRVRAYYGAAYSGYAGPVGSTTYSPNFNLVKDRDIYATLVSGQSGDSSTTTIRVYPLEGFNSDVKFTVEPPAMPPGTTFSFDNNATFNPTATASTTLTYAQYYTAGIGVRFGVRLGPGLTSQPSPYKIIIRVTSIPSAISNSIEVNLNVYIKNPAWREI